MADEAEKGRRLGEADGPGGDRGKADKDKKGMRPVDTQMGTMESGPVAREAAPKGGSGSAAASAPAQDMDATALAQQWHRIRARLKAEVGSATFDSWFKQLELVGVNNGRVLLSVPSRFQRDWIVSNHADRLAKLWTQENVALGRVEILTTGAVSSDTAPCTRETSAEADVKDGVAPTGNKEETPAVQASSASAVQADSPGKLQFDVPAGFEDAGVGAPLDPRFTFDAFVVGKSNELAHAAARRVAEASDVSFNPLFLYGGVGLGKTHLMHAIAWEIRNRQPERKVLYLSAEKFMYQFVRALRFKDTMAFKQQFRSVDVLMIDDVQFISGKDSTQEEFFHTFNALIDHNRQVIISADRSPSDLEGIEERIRSRLGWGLAADIHPTDYELRLGILQAKADEMIQRNGPIEIPPNVLEFLANRIVSNVRELEGALKRVVAYASLVGRPITLDMAQDVLRDLLRSNDRKVTIEEIQRRVAEYYNVRLSDLLSARRARAVARPRQIAMYLSKQLTTRSLPEIGRKFGGRDHTTVIHAVRKVEELRQVDSGLEEDVDLLRRMLEGGHSPN